MNEEKPPRTAELPEQIRELENIAAHLVREQQHEDAERVYREIVRVSPRHVPALRYLAGRALERNEMEQAQNLLERAIRIAPGEAGLHQNLAIVLRARGYHEGALLALDAALKLRPDLTMAWVQRGDVLQALGRGGEAIAMYRQAELLSGEDLLALALSTDGAARNRRKLLGAAHQLAYARMATVHGERIPIRGGDSATAETRVEAAIRHMCRAVLPDYAEPLQRPSDAYVPDLPAHPWFKRNEFPLLAALERDAGAIRREHEAALAAGSGFRPARERSDNSTQAPDSTSRASAYFLSAGGERVTEHCAACPRTLAAVNALELVHLPDLAPEVCFYILPPGGHVAARHGPANYRLAVHLPLLVPSRCALRVGDETRGWRPGECLIFDETFEHEMWNRGEATLGVLRLEVWHPELAEEERAALATAWATLERFNLEAAALARESLAGGAARRDAAGSRART